MEASRPRFRRAHPLALAAGLLLAALPARGAVISGTVFDDADGNGVLGAGEAPIPGVEVRLFGRNGLNVLRDQATTTDASGSFAFSDPALDNGTYILDAVDPPGYRFALARRDCPPAGSSSPLGHRRFGNSARMIENLRGGSFLHLALGDSISAGVSFCLFDDTNYLNSNSCSGSDATFDVCKRLSNIHAGAVTDNQSIAGEDTQDLLVNDTTNNLWAAISASPQMITISIGGNDFLGSEPDCPNGKDNCPAQTEPFDPAVIRPGVERLLSTRQNLQEILSTLVERLPGSDVELNTVYDNWALGCASTDYHNVFAPLWNQVLREVALGQTPRVTVAEIGAEYAHEDTEGIGCCGFTGQICSLDLIHPNQNGAKIHGEKVWEAFGGISLGTSSPAPGQSSVTGIQLPMIRRLLGRPAAIVAPLSGIIAAPDAATGVPDDAGAVVQGGDAELRLSGFGSSPAGDPLWVLVTVRYRTTGTVTDDLYRFEASFQDFAPAEMTPTGWNTVIPVVGASGRSGTPVNAFPDVPAWREVSAALSLPPVDDGGGGYEFPAPGWGDLAQLQVRLRVESRGAGPDAFAIEWDAAWVDVHGRDAPPPEPPGPVSGLRVACAPSGVSLRWDTEPLASGYRCYRGTIGVFYGHSPAGSAAGTSWTDGESLCGDGGPDYWLVSGENAGGEGPCGGDSAGTPIPCLP